MVEGVGDHGCEYMTGGTVVILGSTGRNLGAGFSGGNVYVLDLDMKQVNPAAATNGALLFEPLDADADKLVHGLVKQHAEETGSAFAKALLDDWENSAKRFTHIVPKHFLAMQKAAAADGVTVWMQSGYRSVKYQTSLYERKTKYYLDKGYDNATAKEKAAAVVNPPGYSEHNCGLAADLNSPEHTGLDEGFENTAAFRWLCEHAGDYGFILRYPKDAEDKTEIIYEPWHWRYVGVENAAKINASGLCFEDYIETLQRIAAEG